MKYTHTPKGVHVGWWIFWLLMFWPAMLVTWWIHADKKKKPEITNDNPVSPEGYTLKCVSE